MDQWMDQWRGLSIELNMCEEIKKFKHSNHNQNVRKVKKFFYQKF